MAGTTAGPRPGETESWVATVALTAGKAVIQDASPTEGAVTLPAAKNAESVGIAAHDTEAGKTVLVIKTGTYLCTAGAAIAIGAKVIVADATGKLITDDTASTNVAHHVGTARTAAGADADSFLVDINLENVYIP